MSAAPAAAANQASELTGPIRAAAWVVSPVTSARRTGNRLSKVTIEKPQNSSTPTSAGRTRDPRSSPMPSPITPGTARTEVATAPRPRATRVSVISTAIAARFRTFSPSATISGRTRLGIAGNGSSATRAPDVSAPMAIATLSTALAAPRPFSISASGSAARVASTYHASSGPLSSARKTPCRAVEAANSATESATVRRPSETSPTRLARIRTGRRPSESDRPPVGSSRARTTSPWRLKTRPISVSDRPRDSARRTVTGMSSPVGSQRSPVRTRNRRRARPRVEGGHDGSASNGNAYR